MEADCFDLHLSPVHVRSVWFRLEQSIGLYNSSASFDV